MANAIINVVQIDSTENGEFEITFNVQNVDCNNTACAGFDADLITYRDGSTETELYSFGGWNVGESTTNPFQIRRNGITFSGWKLVRVSNITNPDTQCFD